MTGKLCWKGIGCSVKTGREEEEEESRSMLRRTLNVWNGRPYHHVAVLKEWLHRR